MAPPTRALQHLLQWLISGTRGGKNRGRIIISIREEPMNTNQLRIELNLDYRTVKHHLEILEDNNLVNTIGDSYGKMYYISSWLEENMDYFDKLWVKQKEKVEDNEK